MHSPFKQSTALKPPHKTNTPPNASAGLNQPVCVHLTRSPDRVKLTLINPKRSTPPSKCAYTVSGTFDAVFAQTRLTSRAPLEGLALNELSVHAHSGLDKTLTAFVTVIEEPVHNGIRTCIIAYVVGMPFGLSLSSMPQPFPLGYCGGTSSTSCWPSEPVNVWRAGSVDRGQRDLALVIALPGEACGQACAG